MAKKPAQPEPTQELALFIADNPLLVLTKPDVRDKLFEDIAREVEAFVPDLSTDTGRRAIASLAYKVARTKTAIDEAGLEATEDHRKVINAVNAERNVVKAKLDELRDRARKPLTDWEEAEKARAAKAQSLIDSIKTQGVITLNDTTESVARRTATLKAMELDEAVLGDDMPLAVGARDASLLALDNAYNRIAKEEADRVELERLRAAEREREAQEFARREEARLAAEAEAEAEEGRRRRQREQEEREAREKQQAALVEEARRNADREAAERVAREAQAKIDQANAETEALRKAEADRQESERRAAADAAAREADRAHRGKIMGEAKEAIKTCGVDDDTAKKIVLLIKANECPHVTITF